MRFYCVFVLFCFGINSALLIGHERPIMAKNSDITQYRAKRPQGREGRKKWTLASRIQTPQSSQ
jgi:hypothetical protein